MLTIRNQQVLLDRDVAALYGVETKALNQAVKRNADRFESGYVFQLDAQEMDYWKSQIVTSNLSDLEVAGLKMGLRRAPYAFTERGLYMLATVLNSNSAVRATKAIIETYAQVRSMVRDMEAIQTEKSGSPEQASLLTRAGHKLAGLIGDNLSTQSRKTTGWIAYICRNCAMRREEDRPLRIYETNGKFYKGEKEVPSPFAKTNKT